MFVLVCGQNEMIGFQGSNKYGLYRVVEFNGCNNVLVQWEDGTISKHKAENIRNGSIRNRNFRSKSGVGFIGYGEFNSRTLRSMPYHSWEKMIDRCYNNRYRLFSRYGGRGVTVSDEWHNFQNFAAWYIENYKDGFEIDKDLKYPNSLIYSKETCIMIPHEINSLLLFSESRTGKWPLGVHYHKAAKKFRAACQIGGKVPYVVGMFSNPTDAFYAYKEFKENRIKKLAENHYNSGNICEQTYNSLINYEVTDDRIGKTW